MNLQRCTSPQRPPVRDDTGRVGNNFGIMRLLFACAVLVSHAAEIACGNRSREPLTQLFGTLSFGELGVDCFFILSGFLIAASWERDPRPLPFLLKRVLRIYPGYVVAFLLSFTVVGALGAADARVYLANLDPAAIGMVATLGAPITPATFPGTHYPVVNNSVWTIPYEFICYLLMLALGWTGVLGRWRVTVALWLAALIVSVWVKAMGGDLMHAASSNYEAMLIRLVPLFLSGAVLYKTGVWRVRSPGTIGAAVALLLAGLGSPVLAEAAVATAGAYLLVVAGFAPVPRGVGRGWPDVSYGVYLYGWPVQKLLWWYWPTASLGVITVLSVGVSLLFGLASWFGVERPCLALRDRRWSWRKREVSLEAPL